LLRAVCKSLNFRVEDDFKFIEDFLTLWWRLYILYIHWLRYRGYYFWNATMYDMPVCWI